MFSQCLIKNTYYFKDWRVREGQFKNLKEDKEAKDEEKEEEEGIEEKERRKQKSVKNNHHLFHYLEENWKHFPN